jgi:hypothetical protein
MFRLRLLNETLYVLFSSEVRTLVASLSEILVKGPTHALVNLTLWLQKLIKEEKVKYLCDNRKKLWLLVLRQAEVERMLLSSQAAQLAS